MSLNLELSLYELKEGLNSKTSNLPKFSLLNLYNKNQIIKLNVEIVFLKEMMREIYLKLLNTEDLKYLSEDITEFIYNNFYEYDKDPKKLLRIMMENSSTFSSLIGYFYQHGIGCDKNEVESLNMYKLAVYNNKPYQKLPPHQGYESNDIFKENNIGDINKLNNISGQYFISLFYYNNIISDRQNDLKSLSKLVEKGDHSAEYKLGCCYDIGINVVRNKKIAIDWYAKSSEGGYDKAQYKLGLHYLNLAEDEKAFELFMKSAEKGNAEAQYFIGYCYEWGRYVKTDLVKAFEWYLKSGKSGYKYAQKEVGECYKEGKGVAKDKNEAIYWFRLSVINGNYLTQYYLGSYYLYGFDMFQKNHKKAFYWYLKSAQNFNTKAYLSVAECYRDGIGTERSVGDAKFWFEKAQQNRTINSNVLFRDFLLNNY